MIHAQVINGVVTNISNGELPGWILTNGKSVGIGFTYDGKTFSPPAIDMNAVIRTQIKELEALQTPRRIREATLGTDNGWLADLNNQIAAIRAQLV